MVAKYIKELLYTEEEVIVHDLGVFHCHYASAEIHPAAHTFSPPSKSILFDTQSKITNGLLENTIAHNENISKEEAQNLVKQFVSTVKIDLGINQSYTIDEVGKLALQYEDEISFVQDDSFNYLQESYGLPDIFGEPVERTEEEKNQIKESLKIKNEKLSNNEKPTQKSKKKIPWGGLVAIAAITLIVIWVILVLFVNKDLNPFSFMSQNQDSTKNKGNSYQHEVHTPTSTYSDDEEDPSEYVSPDAQPNSTDQSMSSSDAKSTNEVQQDQNEAEESSPSSNDQSQAEPMTEEAKNESDNTDFATLEMLVLRQKTNKAYIVLGSFSSKTKAFEFARKKLYEGVRKIKIVPPFDGQSRYRVTYGEYTSKEEAKSSITTLKGQLGQDIWALVY